MHLEVILVGLALAQVPPASTTPPTSTTPPASTPPPAVTAPTTEERAAAAAESAARAAESAAKAAQSAADTANRALSTAKATEATPAPTTAASEWKASVGLGLIALTGNTSSITFNGNALAERKLGDWLLSAKASGTYGQSRPEGAADPEVLALAGSLSLRADRSLTQLVSIYALVGTDTDHVKSVEYRAYGELGTGLTWLDQEKSETAPRVYLRTDLGVRGANESRFQYYPTEVNLPDVPMVAPRVGLEFRARLTDELAFLQTGEVLLNVYGPSRTLVNTLSKLSVHLVNSLSLGASFTVAHDSDPAPGKLPTDTALTLGLEYTL